MPPVDFMVTEEVWSLGICVLRIIVLNDSVPIWIEFFNIGGRVFSSMSIKAIATIHPSMMPIPDLPFLLIAAYTCTFVRCFGLGFYLGLKPDSRISNDSFIAL